MGEWTELAGSLRANNFGLPHTVNFVEEVTLPNWDHEDCPLCIESELLNGFLKDDVTEFSDWTLRRSATTEKVGRRRSHREYILPIARHAATSTHH